MLCSGTNGTSINRVDLFNLSGNAIDVNNAKITMNYAYIHDCVGGSVYSSENSQVALNRATIVGNQGSAGYTESNGILIINDSIIHTVCGFNKALYPFYNLSNRGTLTLNDCLILPNPNREDTSSDERILNFDIGTTSINNCIFEQSLFQKARRPAIIYIVCDDTGNLESYFIPTLAPKLEEYGWRGTMAISTSYMMPGTWGYRKWESAKKVVLGDFELGLQGGHEICSHSHTHVPKYNSYEGMSVRYTGGNATRAEIYIKDTAGDGYADQVYTMIDTGEGLKLDQKFSNLDDRADGTNKITSIIDILQATGRYECVFDLEDRQGNGLAQYLADADGVNILLDIPGADLNLDPDRVWRGEALRSKQAIEQHIGIEGYISKSWVSPGNQTSLELQLALLNYGYLGGRAGYNPNDGEPDGRWIEDLNIYSLETNIVSYILGDGTQVDIERRLGAFIEYLMWYGGVASLYVHDGITQEVWDMVFQVLKKAEQTGSLMVLTLGETLEFLRTYDPNSDLSCWENGKQVGIGEGRIYKRTMANNENCRLSSMSPCIDTGSSTPSPEEMDLDGVQFADKNGNMNQGFGDAPDIGAYEYAFGCSLPLGHLNYCSDCGPCAEGEGNCDNDGQCENGLTCVPDLQAPGTDICSIISDTCPNDPNKIVPGICGCGSSRYRFR